jgi:hypothetical protein
MRAQHTHLEGQPVNQMRHSSQLLVLVARAGVDVDSQAREVAGQSFGSYADAIGERGDFVELGGVLCGCVSESSSGVVGSEVG